MKETRECQTLIHNAAPTDKLWDGYLKLNTSNIVSIVAIYKSGEKMPDVKWSEYVDVKGKVKLADFERYVHDIPYSPNRGLMVVSLLWKEGSSRHGLTSMKKVADRYKENERVGFAQLSHGINLYVCPRTEKIITILAKCGFFKGKRAIEENKDSFIGCVVWRRNQINRDSLEQKYERCTHQVAVERSHTTLFDGQSSVAPSSKSLFDDNDDDLPEWFPPNVNESFLVTNHTSLTTIHPVIPNFMQPIQPAATQNHPSFSTQPAHFALQGPLYTGNHPPPTTTDFRIGRVNTSLMNVNGNQPFMSNPNRGVWKG